MSSSLVYVVMLTFNHYADTLQALDSLGGSTYPNFRLLVVDNHSTDGTVSHVRDSFPHIEVLENPVNLGFAAGINVGLRKALDEGAEFVLIVNNDIVVAPSMLEHLVAAMAPGVGASAPLIYELEAPERVWSSGFTRHPVLLEMRGGARGKSAPADWTHPFEVDYLLGCAMLLSSSVLQDIGFFDERFFFYYEDLDFCVRARQAGYRLLVVPQAKMWHKGAGSAGQNSPFRVYQMARGSAIFFGTHARGSQRVASLLFRSGSALKSSLHFILRGQFSLLRSYWRGIWDGWQTLEMGR